MSDRTGEREAFVGSSSPDRHLLECAYNYASLADGVRPMSDAF